MNKMPSGLVPQEDQGFVIMAPSLPPGLGHGSHRGDAR